jgi:histidyl-tRNA synthetase
VPECDVYVVHQGDEAQRLAAQAAETLRDAGFAVVVHAGSSGFKSQFKRADASGARVAVILGGDEVASRTAGVKFLRGAIEQDGGQQQTPLDRLAEAVGAVLNTK